MSKKEINDRYYTKHKDELAARRSANKLAAIHYKGGVCVDCGMDFIDCPECADFDHLPEFEKLTRLSHLMSRQWSVVVQELEKCELVCANCHRKRTVKRLSYASPCPTLL